MQRRTKIIATIGPGSDNPTTLRGMIQVGLNLARINLSHGDYDAHARTITTIRKLAKDLKKEVGILIDLQGPKIRIARFKSNYVTLIKGETFTLDAALDDKSGDENAVGIDYKQLPNEVKNGDLLLLDDGKIVLQVDSIKQSKIHCKVQIGGILSNNKGLNLRGGGLSAHAITEKDKQDILFAAEHNADYVAFSFVKSLDDIILGRQLLSDAKSKAYIVAKIERTEAIDPVTLDAIIKASDAVMVARGDLGVEIGFAEIPGIQKNIIKRAHALNRPVITATQMMESMIDSPVPTRAEVSDVANGVLDGSDALMLSAETAVGKYPVEVIAHMAEICIAAEKQHNCFIARRELDIPIARVDEAIAMSAMYVANHLAVKAVVSLTETGNTPLTMSRIKCGIPIYGISRHAATRGRMTLFRDVFPISFNYDKDSTDIETKVLAELKNLNLLYTNDVVIITYGSILGVSGATDSMKILHVP